MLHAKPGGRTRAQRTEDLPTNVLLRETQAGGARVTSSDHRHCVHWVSGDHRAPKGIRTVWGRDMCDLAGHKLLSPEELDSVY